MKRKVHYAILEDMEKYLADFNPKDYESTTNETDDYVIEMMKKYYDTHLPVDLTAWKRVHDVPETRIWRNQFYNQMHFIESIIPELISISYEDFKNNKVMVISTHRSKSIDLPVYQIDLEKYGVEFSFQSENNKEKSKQTLLEKYGDEHYGQFGSKSFKEKMIKKYGYKYPQQNKKVRNKISKSLSSEQTQSKMK